MFRSVQSPFPNECGTCGLKKNQIISQSEVLTSLVLTVPTVLYFYLMEKGLQNTASLDPALSVH